MTYELKDVYQGWEGVIFFIAMSGSRLAAKKTRTNNIELITLERVEPLRAQDETNPRQHYEHINESLHFQAPL